MRYIDLVKKSKNNSEKTMWESVEHVSDLVDKLWRCHQPMARKFMMQEYELMYGGHFNEMLANAVVDEMWHNRSNVERVDGEIVDVDDAVSILDDDRREDLRWDAYVGVNAFMHDMARVGLAKDDIMELAKEFWFGDDDFDGESKVFWYFKNK